jgi:hypothetical protein
MSLESDMASASTTGTTKLIEDDAFHSRAYQIEMLEESLRRNVIVAVCFSLWPPLLHQLTTSNPDGYW